MQSTCAPSLGDVGCCGINGHAYQALQAKRSLLYISFHAKLSSPHLLSAALPLQDKISAFWEISKKDLEDKKAELRNKDREMEEMEERHQVEIKVSSSLAGTALVTRSRRAVACCLVVALFRWLAPAQALRCRGATT